MLKNHVGALALATALTVVACQQEETVDDIVERMVQAQGGAEALAAIQDQVSIWETTGTFPQGDTIMTMTSGMTITYKRPDKIKFESKMPDGTLAFASVFDGTTGWQYMLGMGTREMSPAEIEETTTMAETWIDGWLNYADKGMKLNKLPDTTMNETRYHVIEATDRFGNVSTNYCNAQTAMIERMDSEMTDPMSGTKTPSVMTLTDYASYDGFMMAKVVAQHDGQGNKMFESILKELNNNVGVEDEVFAKPQP